MKQILSSISILLLLIIFSISDFDFGNFPDASDTVTDWDASQYQYECTEHKLSDQVMTGSDGACVAASMEMLMVMDKYEVNCLFITNPGWIPASYNPVTRHWANWSLANDAPY